MEVEVKVCGPIDYSSFRPWYFAPGTLKAAVIIRSKPYATVLHINTLHPHELLLIACSFWIDRDFLEIHF